MPTENLHNESNPFHKTILIKLRMFADKDRRATCVEWGSYFWGGNMCLFWVYTFLWRQKKSTAYARKIIGQILGVLRNGRKKTFLLWLNIKEISRNIKHSRILYFFCWFSFESPLFLGMYIMNNRTISNVCYTTKRGRANWNLITPSSPLLGFFAAQSKRN